MDQLKTYADNRLINGCIYCGGPAETRDHVPPRTLLESPYPENLPFVGACWECNNGFSLDEEYFACLIYSVIAGSTDPDKIKLESVVKSLQRSPALRAKIEAAKRIVNGQIVFDAEQDRIKRIVLKLAMGHAAFEISQPCLSEPDVIWWSPLILMSDEERNCFNSAHVVEMFGELGSRGTQRMMAAEIVYSSEEGVEFKKGFVLQDWVEVQDDFYRYLAIDDVDGIVIKMVIGEYLACKVIWR